MGREEGISKMPLMCGISVAVENCCLLAAASLMGGGEIRTCQIP